MFISFLITVLIRLFNLLIYRLLYVFIVSARKNITYKCIYIIVMEFWNQLINFKSYRHAHWFRYQNSTFRVVGKITSNFHIFNGIFFLVANGRLPNGRPGAGHPLRWTTPSQLRGVRGRPRQDAASPPQAQGSERTQHTRTECWYVDDLVVLTYLILGMYWWCRQLLTSLTRIG